MSVASSIAKFLHLAKADAAATEEKLKEVIAAVRPEVSSLKTQVIAAVGLDIAHVATDMKNALEILDHEHKADIAGAVSTLESSFADIFKRFDDIRLELAKLGTDTAQKTASARKTAAATAAAAAKAAAAPVKDTPAK